MLGMISYFVLFELMFPTCLIVTLVTRIFHTLMHRFFVGIKTALLCCLIVTRCVEKVSLTKALIFNAQRWLIVQLSLFSKFKKPVVDFSF